MKVKVLQDEDKKIPVEILAKSIKEISDGMKAMRSGRLNDRAIVTLLQKITGESATTIFRVMDGLENLEREFLK